MTVDADQATMTNKVAGEPFDAWDKESNDYHARYAMANAVAGGGNAYGLSDLNYYGNFINAGAYGQIWQPYLTGAGWSPYGNGMWAFYPGAGYSWVSPYPWGWLPYHSGAWNFYPGYGWGWQPGGSWMGLNNIAGSGFAPTGSSFASATAANGRCACSDAASGSGFGSGTGSAFDGAVEPDTDGLLETGPAWELCVHEGFGRTGSSAWVAWGFAWRVE